MRNIFLPMLLFLFGNASAQIEALQQTVISSGGEVLTANNYMLHFSIGEVVTTTLTASSKMLTQGFHQGELLVMPTDVADIGTLQPIKIHPNPTQAVLYVELAFEAIENIDLVLYDATGKPIRRESYQIQAETLTLDWTSLPQSTYHLQIINTRTGQSSSHQIIKL